MDKKVLVMNVLTDYPQLQKDIVNKLKAQGMPMSTRELRSTINKINKDFINGKIDFVVISNKNGTYKSDDIIDINNFNNMKIRHAKSELWSAYNINKRFNHRGEISLLEFIEKELANGE